MTQALKKHTHNEIMPSAATWINLEMIILTKRKNNIIKYHLEMESKNRLI